MIYNKPINNTQDLAEFMDWIMTYLDLPIIRSITLEKLIKLHNVQGILAIEHRRLSPRIRNTGKFDNIRYKDPISGRMFSGWVRKSDGYAK